jgi:hypothetical protein
MPYPKQIITTIQTTPNIMDIPETIWKTLWTLYLPHIKENTCIQLRDATEKGVQIND